MSTQPVGGTVASPGISTSVGAGNGNDGNGSVVFVGSLDAQNAQDRIGGGGIRTVRFVQNQAGMEPRGRLTVFQGADNDALGFFPLGIGLRKSSRRKRNGKQQGKDRFHTYRFHFKETYYTEC